MSGTKMDNQSWNGSSLTDRTRENAPIYVRERGGVLLSLWFYGADETDLNIVASIIERCEIYRTALERISDEADEHFGPGPKEGAEIRLERCEEIAEEALR